MRKQGTPSHQGIERSEIGCGCKGGWRSRKFAAKLQWAGDQRSGDFSLTNGPSILNRIGGDVTMMALLHFPVKRSCMLLRDF
jgi:hypothetical protein